ncbi:MAG: type II secretion system F family protein [Candidatus Methanoperedens sp.]|nr:type II secretion system F family protein [Candidatus Methanoperedens sp.]
MGISTVDLVSYRIFGKWVESRIWEYLELSHKLVQARIGVPLEVYISRAYFVSILASLPLGMGVYMLMQDYFNLLLGSYSFLIIPFLSFLFGYMFFSVFLAYPSITARLRGRKIDIVMPHTVALMHALSKGSSNIINFFEIIGNNKEIYGEVSAEVKGALIETKIFHKDLKTALKNMAEDTPSESFKNFIESLSTIITSGSDIVAFFLAKSEQYRVKALNENKAFMDTLGLLSEVYVICFVAGPLFIIVLLVVLGLVGGTKYFLLLMIVYIWIPGGSLLFLVLLDTLAEGAGSGFIKIKESSKEGENLLIQKGIMRMQIYGFFKHPLKKLVEVPEKVLYFSIPIALIFFILTTYGYYNLEYNEMIYKIDDYIIFAVLIALIPYSLFVEAHFRRINQISREFPEFLNRLVSLHESGLTLAASIKRLTTSKLGVLTSEINKINTDIELKGNFAEAFQDFGKRVNTVAVQRFVILIENAIRMTGNIKDTLAIAASDATTARALEEERMSSTKMNVVVIYISFFVFLYVAWSLVTGFFPQLPEVPIASLENIAGEGIAFSGIDKPLYVRLFFHASVFGFFSGLVAGQMGEGDARLGLKHGIIMTAIAYLLFAFIT